MPKARKIIIFLIIIAVIVGFFFIWLSDKYTVPILMYHSIDYSEQYNFNMTDPDIFAWQMKFLKEHNYRVISLDELISKTKKGEDLPHKSVVITFDDGYLDNYTNAFVHLKENGFPTTIFVSTDQIKEEGYLTWEQIREMEKYGVTVGSHTINQTYLPDALKKEQQHQINKSKEILEENLGHPICCLSYPAGGFSEEIKEIVKRSGYKGACTTNRGYDRFNKDAYELNRIRISNNDNSSIVFWAKLSGYYNLFREAKEPY